MYTIQKKRDNIKYIHVDCIEHKKNPFKTKENNLHQL